MHERRVMEDLVRAVREVEAANGARPVRIRVRLGALSHFTPEHFLEHWEDAARTSSLEGCEVEIEESADATDPGAQGVRLLSVDVEDGTG